MNNKYTQENNSIIEHQYSDLETSLTRLFMSTKTQKNIITDTMIQSLSKKLIEKPDLLQNIILKEKKEKNNKKFAYIISFLQDHKIIDDKWNFLETNQNRVVTILRRFQDETKDILDNDEYKSRYSQQLVIGVARMEWIDRSLITSFYDDEDIIDEKMQKLFTTNNVTLMDFSYDSLELSEEDQNLLLYSMLFVHDGEQKNKTLATQSEYYNIEGKNITIKPYGIKAFEQAFNCAWQIYNEIFFITENELPHHDIKSKEDIIKLYKSREEIRSGTYIISKEEKPVILNLMRSLLHLQAHKRLDYIDGKHDPESLLTYEAWKSRKEIYKSKFDMMRDRSIKDFFSKEFSYLTFTNPKWERIDSKRSPNTYDWEKKSWLYKDVMFNGAKIQFSGRSKNLQSTLIKLWSNDLYKKAKKLTDDVANSLYTENQKDSMRVWLGLIEQFPDELLKKGKFAIKWEKSWELFLEEISKDKSWQRQFDQRIAIDNLKKYGISEHKVKQLFANDKFMWEVDKKLQGVKAGELIVNNKTNSDYEEFKLVTKTGTEYQCITKRSKDIISYNEEWLWIHSIYDMKKLIGLKMRPNNNSMTYDAKIINKLIDGLMIVEEKNLMWKAEKLWLFEHNDKILFDPWKALFYQIMRREADRQKNNLDTDYKKSLYDTIYRDYMDNQGNILLTKENAEQYILEWQHSYFLEDRDNHYDIVERNKEGIIINSPYKDIIKERYYNILNWYTNMVASNKNWELSIIMTQKWLNTRALRTQLEWKKIFDKKKKT